MSITLAREHLARYGFEDRILEFSESSATVELAAIALGVEPGRIAKSLSFYGPDGPMMILAAGDRKIDNPKYKALFHCKAKMLSPADVEALIGHPVGGVCPFGIREDVRVYLDVSLKDYDTVFPAAGTSSSAVRLTPDELYSCSGADAWVDVVK